MKRILIGLAVCILIAILVGLAPLSATAQTQDAHKYKVDMKVDLDWMSLDFEGGGNIDVDTYSVVLDVGYFINDMFEVGPEVFYKREKTDFDGISNETTSWAFFAKGNAHFSTNPEVKPYAGLRVGLSSLDFDFTVDNTTFKTDDTAFAYGAQLGLDYFITNNVSVNPELRYTRTSYDFEGVDTDSDDISFMIGFGIFF